MVGMSFVQENSGGLASPSRILLAIVPERFNFEVSYPFRADQQQAKLRGYAVPVFLFALMFASSFALGQSEFSADVVTTRKDGKDGSAVELKIYVGEMKARLEPQFLANPNSPTPPLCSCVGESFIAEKEASE